MTHQTSFFRICAGAFLALAITPSSLAQKTIGELLGIDNTIDAIQSLEAERDPKCYATAARLEDFMYGTPLAEAARFRKVELQKNLIRRIWGAADQAARHRAENQVTAADVRQASAAFLRYRKQDNGDYLILIPRRLPLTIKSRDYRQYGSVAYALRAILGVQQDSILLGQTPFQPMEDAATQLMKEIIDLAALATLQTADQAARAADQYILSEQAFASAWDELFGSASAEESAPAPAIVSEAAPTLPKYHVTRQIIAQKLRSYEAYNKLSTPLFLRNIQVYFARHRWPQDSAQSEQLKSFFNQALVFYATDLLYGAEKVAEQAGHSLIRVEDVHRFSYEFVPFRMNEYEDAIFFPRLPLAQQVYLESYDMDAFRDSGLHWRYLEAVLDQPDFRGQLEPDPFAAELLVESIAQFGVLVLRVAGDIAQAQDKPYLEAEHIELALRQIQQRINQHSAVPDKAQPEAVLVSSTSPNPAALVDGESYFSDVTAHSGIQYEHRLADWLSRLIRSYTIRNRDVAILAVPPAFGGSGIAAEDLNDDGLPEVLLLGGLGNRLYLNLGNGQFSDITQDAGLEWRREDDGLPGETRQPIIADFDNDGFQDIFISYVNDKHRLYRNRGDSRFDDVTARAGLGGAGVVGGPATALDYDNDGLLDLYIGYFGQYTEGTIPTLARRNDNGLPNKLFKNMGEMRFVDVTEGSGVANTGWTQALSHTDLDRDGWQDLIVGNDFGVNSYYRNLGNGTFVDIADQIGTSKPSFTMSVGVGDLNDDLFPDIYISNIVTMDKDQKYVSPGAETPQKFDAATMANMRVVEANDLFISQAQDGQLQGLSLSSAVGRGYSATGWAWGADFFDFDNDGDSDLYVANGMNDFAVYSAENPYFSDSSGKLRDVLFPDSQRDANVFFENQDGKLNNASEKSGTALLGNSRAVAYLDLDDDGDLDMILNNFNSPAVVYRNNMERLNNHWLKVRLIGDPKQGTNRDAIGARIIVSTPKGGRLWREVHSSVGYLSMYPKQQHFGLGEAATVTVTVEWPNGKTSVFKDVQADQAYLIKQASGALSKQKQVVE